MPASSLAPFPVSPPETRPEPSHIGAALAFIGAHVVLGIAAAKFPPIASAQGALTALVAVVVAFTSARIDRIVAIAAYCAVCDVFWRMTVQNIMPWEGGKYLSMLVMLIAFFRFVRHPKNIQAPLLMLVLLLPGCAMALVILGPKVARDLVSSNIAGPVLLCVGVMLMRQLIGTEREVTTILWAMLGPIAAIATMSTQSTVAAGALNFSNKSNFETTAGFGPNQVSIMLGLGALVCILLCLARPPVAMMLFQIGLACWFTAQAALSFSRGGLYSLAVGVIAIVIASLSTHGVRSRAVTGVIIGALVIVALYPALNAFTDGALEERIQNTNNTNRSEIASADLDLFVASPFVGVGVGVAKFERANTDTGFATETKAHTEYTRLLAEHGALGLVVVVLMLVMAVQGLRRCTTRWNRLLTAGCLAWALLTMAHSATSVAAIGFVFALSQIRLTPAASP